jgi:uncharacterized protein
LARLKQQGFGYPLETFYSSVQSKRLDARPENGGVAGSDYDTLRTQLLDKYAISHGVLSGEGISGLSFMPDRDYPTALARAYNDWLINTWLTFDDRLLGGLHIALQDPEAAAAEIYRAGQHPRIVQVCLPSVKYVKIDTFNRCLLAE